jgi:hypothetical protein
MQPLGLSDLEFPSVIITDRLPTDIGNFKFTDHYRRYFGKKAYLVIEVKYMKLREFF